MSPPASFLVKSLVLPVVTPVDITDTFNRADATNLNGLTTTTGGKQWSVLSGAITHQGGAVYSVGSSAYAVIDPEQDSKRYDIDILSVGASGGALFWGKSPTSHWYVEFSSGNVIKIDGGTLVDLPLVLGAFAAGDKFGVYYSSTEAKFYKNGVLVGTTPRTPFATDVYPQQRKVGLRTSSGDTTTGWDNFRVYEQPISFTDDFNRSDRSLNGDNGWVFVRHPSDASNTGAVNIVSNRAELVGYGPSILRDMNATRGTLSAKVDGDVVASFFGLWWNMTTTSRPTQDGYYFRVTDGKVYKMLDGVATEIGTLSNPSQASGVFSVSRVGDVHTISRDGTTLLTFTDGTYNGSFWGFGSSALDADGFIDQITFVSG